MKLGKRLLIPILVVSIITVTLCGVVFYRYMQNQIDTIYQGEIRTTLAGLETQMELTGGVNSDIIARVDEKNIALSRSIASHLRQEPDYYLTSEGIEELVAMMALDEVHIVEPDGTIVFGSDSAYWSRNITEMPQNAHLLENMEDPYFAEVQEPRVNSAGKWVQYYVVPRTDAPGLIVVGIEYSIAAMLQQTFTEGINAELSTVGETGHIAVLRHGVYAAHPDEGMVGADVGGEGWYQSLSESDSAIQWLTIDGTQYLAGHQKMENDMVLLALLPGDEYYYASRNMLVICAILVVFACALIVAILYSFLRRNVVKPIEAVSGAMSRVAAGDFTVSMQTPFTGEMERLRLDINQTVTHLRSRQDNLLSNFPGVVFSCDAGYVCTVLAGQGVAELDLHPEDSIGYDIREATTQHGEPSVAKLIENTFAYGDARMNVEFKGRYLSFTGRLMHDYEDNVSGMVGVCVDVTDMRRMQEDLMRATEEAERASQAKSEFLSRMSHEIRTPMNAIIGMTTIAQKARDKAKVEYCLDKIQIASGQLLGLINDILDMSKIEANKFELSEGEFDFESMLQNVCSVIEVNATEKKQDFVIDFADVFTRNVVTDELRLSQVLINLLNNAVKFTPEGGQVKLKIRYHDVDQSFGRFRFDIIDDGIGISAEQQKRLFTSFEQADGSITRRYGGTGLGLAICKNIIQMMGGDISVESTEGKGSQFSFSINVGWGNEKGTMDRIHKLPMGDIRVLVIDDSEDVCLYFENILNGYQIGCDTALSGPEGIHNVELALEQDKPYNLIFVDWMMPGMDGIETARHIKNLAPPDTIVIMISVADWSEIEKQARSIGVDKFLAKPVLPAVLFRSIVGWLNTSAGEKAAETAPAAPSFAGKTMLLAEDIDINREIIAGMLEGSGIEVESAEDGKEAVEKYTAEPQRYDVILMDIQMPVMDGYEATALLRGSGVSGSKTVPIIAMTANAFSSDVERCLAAGMNDHIAKPVDIDDLYKKLEAAFAQ